MARYMCESCGRSFDKPACHEEGRGEYWGYPAYEEVWGCPYCGGSYEEE